MDHVEISLLSNEDKSTDTKPPTCISRSEKFLSSPKTILGISSLYLLMYVGFIVKEGGFSTQFLHIGPGVDSSNTASFIGIKLDSWSKVLMMYFISFISAVMSNYYSYAMINNLHSYIWNRAIPKVPFSKRWTYIVILSEPLLMEVLTITTFFTTLTLQLQFIIPQFIGATLIEIPFTFQRLREKEYEFA
jgi:hypothetical protein